MVRLPRVAALVVVLALCAELGGCAPKPNGVLGYEVDGETVAAQIDRTIVPALRAAHPALAFGKTACPGQIDVAYDATGTCTIPAGGTSLPVEVANGPGSVPFVVHRVQALLVLDETEKRLSAQLLETYGIRAAVRCGEPRVRVVAVKTELGCTTALTSRRPVRLAVTVWDRDGDAGFWPLPGVPALATTALGPYLRAHADGRPAVVPGPVLARLVHAQARALLDGDIERLRLLGAASCPARADFTGSRHVVCTVRVGGKPLRRDMWMNNGWIDTSAPVVVDVAQVRAMAARFFQDDLAATGLTFAAIDCGPDRIVIVEPGSALPCTVSKAGQSVPLSVTVTDHSGRVRFGDPSAPEEGRSADSS